MTSFKNSRLLAQTCWVCVFSIWLQCFSPLLNAKPPVKNNNPFSSKNKPLVAVLEVFSESLSADQLQEISNTFRREVQNTQRFSVYSRSEMRKALTQNINEEVTASRQIDQYLQDAKNLYENFKFESAEVILREALKVVPRFDVTPDVARRVSEAYLFQALVFDALGKQKEAHTAFLNAAALDSNRQLEPSLYAPSVISQFHQAKEEYVKIQEGSLRIETTPPLAEVYIGGKKQGTSPITLKNLPLGIQTVRLVKSGYEPWERQVIIVASGENDYSNQLKIEIAHNSTKISLEALMGEIISRKTLDLQILKIADVGKLLSTNQVFAARIQKSKDGYQLFSVQIDSQTSQVLARGYTNLAENLVDIDIAVVRMLREMLSQKMPDQFTKLIAVESKGGKYLATYKQKKPFYKRWPFYVLLGVVAAGIGGGTAFALSRNSGASTVIGTPTNNRP